MASLQQHVLSSQPFVYAANISASLVEPAANMVSSWLQTWTGGDSSLPICRCMPGDACWPSKETWDAFSSSVGGRLVQTVPIGSPCHDESPTGYDEAACAHIKNIWLMPDTHWPTSSSIMTNYFANATCSPFTDRSIPCTLGGYVSYSVNATGADDYLKTISFTKQHNIRTVIRNTGHDYYGKSTGAGAVAIWTHFLKDIEFLDYASPHWTGKAAKLGAGVQAQDINAAAAQQGLVVVTGDCPTIAVPGGFSQGGGHGPLISKFGLGADQVLEWEVITANGTHIVATPEKNDDLYWALSGGGAGSWGVVLTATVKAFPDEATSFMDLSFTAEGVSEDVFYEAIGDMISNMPSLVDAGGTCLWYLFPGFFTIVPAMAPGLSQASLDAIFAASVGRLTTRGIKYEYKSAEFPGFWQGLNAMRPEPNITNMNWENRLIPRSVLEQNLDGLVQAYRNMIEHGAATAGYALNVGQTRKPGDAANAAVPAWRDAIMDQVIANAYDETNLTQTRIYQNIMTEKITPELANLIPGGGNAYGNEGDFQEPNFQQVFYGENYNKLRAIKKKYDPEDFWYGLTSVGSEAWESREDGRLCRTGK